jgi:hypothetical protein
VRWLVTTIRIGVSSHVVLQYWTVQYYLENWTV